VGQFVVDSSKVALETPEPVQIVCHVVAVVDCEPFHLREKIVSSTLFADFIPRDDKVIGFLGIAGGLNFDAIAVAHLGVEKLVGSSKAGSIGLLVVVVNSIAKCVGLEALKCFSGRSDGVGTVDVFLIVIVDVVFCPRFFEDLFISGEKVKNFVGFCLSFKISLPCNEVDFTAQAAVWADVKFWVGYSGDLIGPRLGLGLNLDLWARSITSTT
jgi:hypothetical protein